MENSGEPDARELALRVQQLPQNERESYLDDQCAPFPGLLERVAQQMALATEPPERTPALGRNTLWGSYELLEVVGEGGLGTVYLAQQHEPVQRRVALKVVKAGMDSREVLARFQQESQMLSLLEHPNIATVLDAGSAHDGRPYFVMEFVPGESITSFCDREALTLERRLRLFQQVCRGVEHAHQKAIIHRDLKPSNVLVSSVDGEPVVKIIDFGIAKATQSQRADVTQLGQVIGTPEFMAPEQASGGTSDVDTRVDVYSLGALLYELLVGAPPFDAAELRSEGLEVMLRTLREVDPLRPSERLLQHSEQQRAAVARCRQVEWNALRGKLRNDLDWVVMRALEKQRSRRYGSAHELCEDVERFLQHVPLVARPPTSSYQLKKLFRRYRGSVLATTLVFLALLVGMGWALVERTRANRGLARILSLSDIKLLEDNIVASEKLWPAAPHRVAAMREWIVEAELLLARAPTHRENLQRLRDKSGVAVLQSGSEPSWSFAENEEEWQHGVLLELLRRLTEFGSAGGTVAEVRARIAEAERIEALTLQSPQAEEAWEQAIASIADTEQCPHYGGLVIERQFGLLPLDRNPHSNLWEFWHAASGERPRLSEPGARSRWQLTADVGMVFVLLPPGTFLMGGSPPTAQLALEEQRFDAQAQEDEAPLTQVSLDPFFVSKYEVTQSQWLRMSGENPSNYGPEMVLHYHRNTPYNPVENVSWEMCSRLAYQRGLQLPSEAQWEYAARGGSSTTWWCGTEIESIAAQVAGNLADAQSQRVLTVKWPFEAWEDPWILHAPVGSFAANRFGLHDVIGNLWEWCSDTLGNYDVEPQPGTGHRHAEGQYRVYRGGSFATAASEARVANRNGNPPSYRTSDVGLRPVRMLKTPGD